MAPAGLARTKIVALRGPSSAYAETVGVPLAFEILA